MSKEECAVNLDSSQIVELLSMPKRILCIGDLIIDLVFKGTKYELGSLEDMLSPVHTLRESNEVFDCDSFNMYPGGVAGLACYLQTLGNQVTMISTCGYADEKDEMKHLFTKTMSDGLIAWLGNKGVNSDPINSLVITEGKPTPIKIYCYTTRTQSPNFVWAPRLDLEGPEARSCVDENIEKILLKKLLEFMTDFDEKFDAVVIVDGQKGLLSHDVEGVTKPSLFAEEMVKKLQRAQLDKHCPPIFIDPMSHWEFFRNLKIRAVLPNHESVTRAVGHTPAFLHTDTRDHLMGDLKKFAENLFDKFTGVDNFVIKCEQHGVLGVVRDHNRWTGTCKNMQAWPVTQVCSTVGCGNVFDSYFISLVLRGSDPWSAIEWANLAGGFRAEKGIGAFPDISQLEDFRATKRRPALEEINNFRSRVSAILESFGYPGNVTINIDDCVLVSVRLDDGETKIVMAREGAILETARKAVRELKNPDSKVLLYGESRSGKKVVGGVVAQAIAGERYKMMPYSGRLTLSQKDLEGNEVLVLKDVDMSNLLDLGEKAWRYRNSNGENIDLRKKRIIFDFSVPATVDDKKIDIRARGITPLYHPYLGESENTLMDAAFFIGNLLSKAGKNIETSVFASLLLYPYGPGKGWNILNDMVNEAISRAESRGRSCVTVEGPEDVSYEDTSQIVVKPRKRSEDKLETILP